MTELENCLVKLINSLEFESELDINNKVVQYLDVDLYLQTGSVSPYTKTNTELMYVNAGSNRLASVIRHIPKGTGCGLNRNYSCRVIFIYEKTLKEEGHKTKKKHYLF